MGDVVDLLGLSKAELAAAKADAAELKQAAAKKRPMGIPKEVYSLLSPYELENLSPVPKSTQEDGTLTKAHIKALATKQASKWEWTSFSNGGRVDDLKLSHWECKWKQARKGTELDMSSTKASSRSFAPKSKKEKDDIEMEVDNTSTQGKKPYAYAKFNRRPYVVTFTDEEYLRLHPSPEPNDSDQSKEGSEVGWTKEETKFLFYLCEKYNLTWFVIHDRWTDRQERRFFDQCFDLRAEQAAEKMEADTDSELLLRVIDREVIDLKARYFFFSQEVLRSRSDESNKPPSSSQNPLSDDSKGSQILYHRLMQATECSTTSKLATEQAIATTKFSFLAEAIRIKNLDAYQRRRKEDIERDYELVNEINEIDKQIETLLKDIKAVQKLKGVDDEVTVEYLRKHSTVIEQYVKTKNSLDEQDRRPIEMKRRGRKKSVVSQNGVALRSARLMCLPSEIALGKRMVEKTSKILDELRVPTRPIPTNNVMDAYDVLRRNIIKLLVLQKHLATKKKV